jgi:hypothetical protein
MEVDVSTEAEDGLPGSDLVEECREDIEELNDAASSESLSNKEIDEIQTHLCMITRPSWHRGAPQNLGNPEHGKLKAEQWRGSIEFDLPVILWKLWGAGSDEDSEQSSRRRKLAECTLLFATAIQWGSSYVTSEVHARQYKYHMRRYYESLTGIFPEISWRPNHHAALHLDTFLQRYGPLHGWWMFPFERIIGCLQKTSTNHKSGKPLLIMIHTFLPKARGT